MAVIANKMWLVSQQACILIMIVLAVGFLLRKNAERKAYGNLLFSFAKSHTKQCVLSMIAVALVTMLCGCSSFTETSDFNASNDNSKNSENSINVEDNTNTENNDNNEVDEIYGETAEFDIQAELAEVEIQADQLEKKMQEEAFLTQEELNGIQGALYLLWDNELNVIWNRLKETLSEEEMAALIIEEREWIAYKEIEAEAVGEAYEGESIPESIISSKKAELTRDRVYELAEYLTGERKLSLAAPEEEVSFPEKS